MDDIYVERDLLIDEISKMQTRLRDVEILIAADGREFLLEIHKLEDDLTTAIQETSTIKDPVQRSKELGKYAVEIYSKTTRVKKCIEDVDDATGTSSISVHDAFERLCNRLYNDAFHIGVATPAVPAVPKIQIP